MNDDDDWKDEEVTVEDIIKSFDEAYPPTESDVKADEIGGLDQIIDKLHAFENGILHPELYDMFGINPPNGFILCGKPGTGKTYLARYLASSLRARFVDLPLSQYESKWVGDAAKGLTRHLKNMRIYNMLTDTKILLFFDEAEETLKRRDAMGWHGPRVNVLLREMDGLGDNRGIIFGAATNHLEKVDPAFLRAGRFDFVIDMPKYTPESISTVYQSLKRRFNRKAPHHNPYYLSEKKGLELAVLSYKKDMTPADIKEIFRLAAEYRVREIINSGDEIDVNPRITYHDLRRQVEAYHRHGETQKRMGFIDGTTK